MDNVPESSPLADLRARVEQARARAVTDLNISGLEQVFVRYKALDYETVEQVQKQAKKGGDLSVADRSIVARACVGIFVEDDGRLLSIDPDADCHIDADGVLHGTPVTFNSDRLADLLGIDTPARPAETVPALFPLPLEMGRHATQVAKFSAGEIKAVQKAALGN